MPGLPDDCANSSFAPRPAKGRIWFQVSDQALDNVGRYLYTLRLVAVYVVHGHERETLWTNTCRVDDVPRAEQEETTLRI